MKLPLAGLRVLNTRPLEQGRALTDAIIAAGGISITCPALVIEPIEFSVPKLDDASQAIFISANAVHYLFERLKQLNLQWPQDVVVIAVGQGTATALRKYGVEANLIPLEATSESLLRLETLKSVANETLLLIKGQEGRTTIAKTLISRGANLRTVDVYKRVKPPFNLQFLHSLWHEKAVDIILFTSQQSMQNLFAMFGDAAHSWLCNTPCLVISERLATAAKLLGIKQIMVSSPSTILQTLDQFKQGLAHGE